MPKHWQTALFEKFKIAYRNKFTSKFASADEYNQTMLEWGYALADLSPEQVAFGIQKSITTLTWPPEIAQFIELARPKEQWKHAGQAYQNYRKALPKPINKELAKSAISAIKEIL